MITVVTGFVRMWRAWTVIVPVVLVNAIVQALLIWPDVSMDAGLLVPVMALASGVMFLVSFGLAASCSLQVGTGRVGWGEAIRVLGVHFWRYVVWAVLLGAAVTVGLALWTIPGLVILAVTPFLLLAAIDGARRPLVSNFRVIGRCFWRWLVTALIAGLVLLLGDLLAGVTAFFVRGPLASFLVWTGVGLGVAWITTAWALIYGRAMRPEGETADPPERAPGSPEVDDDEASTYP